MSLRLSSTGICTYKHTRELIASKMTAIGGYLCRVPAFEYTPAISHVSVDYHYLTCYNMYK